MFAMIDIQGFHAHVYYNESTYEQASALCDQAAQLFDVVVGRKHRQAIGPHLKWSCQLKFTAGVFAELTPWLALHRHGLTVFIHPETGNDRLDHTEYAMWMGSIEPLNLSIFQDIKG